MFCWTSGCVLKILYHKEIQKLLIENYTKKNNIPSSPWKFFLKTSFISALMVVANLLHFSSIHQFFGLLTFSTNLFMTQSICFASFICYCLCLYWIKTKSYSGNKAKPFMFVTFACIVSQMCVNLTGDTLLFSQEKKFILFSWNCNVWMFNILNDDDGTHQFSC